MPRANGVPDEQAVTIETSDPERLIKSVIIAADSVDGNHGGDCFGLSAVRFALEREPGEAQNHALHPASISP